MAPGAPKRSTRNLPARDAPLALRLGPRAQGLAGPGPRAVEIDPRGVRARLSDDAHTRASPTPRSACPEGPHPASPTGAREPEGRR